MDFTKKIFCFHHGTVSFSLSFSIFNQKNTKCVNCKVKTQFTFWSKTTLLMDPKQQNTIYMLFPEIRMLGLIFVFRWCDEKLIISPKIVEYFKRQMNDGNFASVMSFQIECLVFQSLSAAEMKVERKSFFVCRKTLQVIWFYWKSRWKRRMFSWFNLRSTHSTG